MYISFQSGTNLRIFRLETKATLGSAESNPVQLQGKFMRPLHGQLQASDEQLLYQDFATRQVSRLALHQKLTIGDWQLELETKKDLVARWGRQILESFKSSLKAQSESLERALNNLRPQFFFGGAIPCEIEAFLRAEFNELSLLGPVEYLLSLDDVTDILVEKFDSIWIEQAGQLQKSSFNFSSQVSYQLYLENLLVRMGKTVDETHPYLDFVLPDGSRGHLIVPPLTNQQSYLSIRKTRTDFFSLQKLLDLGMLSAALYQELLAALKNQKNVLVSGATGSGKTTLIRALLNECESRERIVVLEDTPELALPRPNTAFLYTRSDGRGIAPPVSLRVLVKQSLRMRPDRIIVGEVRGEEALDLLQAMNTGHRGCMGSLHANSCRDALFRLQGLVQMAEASLSEGVTRDLMARNLHMIIHCGRDFNRRRKVLEYGFIRGLDQNQILLETKVEE